jgi:hypothetical protein
VLDFFKNRSEIRLSVQLSGKEEQKGAKVQVSHGDFATKAFSAMEFCKKVTRVLGYGLDHWI